MSVSANTIVNMCEQAIRDALLSEMSSASITIPIYESDLSDIKADMPYIVVHAEESTELISPGSGLFEVSITVLYRSHVKENSPATRDAVIRAINNFAYNSPASILSQTSNYHCYGFVPVSGDMKVSSELKAYEYETRWKLYCMPRDNS